MRRLALVSALALVLVLAGCVAPGGVTDPAGVAAEDAPLLVVPETITKLELAGSVEFGAGNDLAFRGQHAFVSTHNNGMHVIDISDPAAPFEVATVACNGKDIDTVLVEGRLIVTISSQSDDQCPDAAPKGGIRLVDVTNASAPIVLGQVPLAYGSHTHTTYGDTGILYNSAYNLASDATKSPLDHHRSEIIDVTDPDAPQVVGEFLFPQDSTSMGCHDILDEPHLDRAICGGISETMIWDTTDPLTPKVVSYIRNPKISIHHSAATARDGTLLILGDEYAGVLAPACHPAGKAPTGALWFYDITNPATPVELGFFPPPAGDAGKACTAHNFNVVDGRDVLVAGFYSAGTVMVDFTDPKAPTMLDQQRQPGTSSWASYHYRGAVFSGDGGRGFDAYRLV